MLRENSIYYGDCLHVLQKFPEESIDLIYVDPPFFTQKYYEDPFGDGSAIKAFQDSWYDNEGRRGNIFCYLEYMESRLQQMYRILKHTGSFYLHCDWHANYKLREMLNDIFGQKNFRNEIVWCYGGGGVSKRDFPRKHDTILRYSKGDDYTFNVEYRPYKEGTKVHSGGMSGHGKVDLKRGTPIPDWWVDIKTITGWSPEKLGYPTQKPEALLERIIKASSNPTDIVLDPMCGCGTAVAVAHKLARRWIGIDVSVTACKLMVDRLRSLRCDIKEQDIINLPRSLKELKKIGPFEFQKWCVDKLYGRINPHKSGDMGIDGVGFDGTPIQVKQSKNVGRNVIDNFETAIRRKKKKRGFIIAFSFTRTSRDEVGRVKREEGLEIELITVGQLLKKEFNQFSLQKKKSETF